VLHDISMSLPPGSRTLLVGDNGAGKSTLLRVLAGKHLVASPESGHARGGTAGGGRVTVLGKDSYYDTSLNASRAYLATDWGRRSVAFTGHGLPLSADVAVRDMMADTQAAYLSRRDELVALLGVDLDWRMHQLSDGQRRRVQIMLQLLRPVGVLLLDEITTDLDLITRQDFLNYLRDSSAPGRVSPHACTIVYATHIFDGLDAWPTHLAYVNDGRLVKFGPVADFPELAQRHAAGAAAPLLRTIEAWLREARAAKVAAGRAITETATGASDELRGELTGNGYLSGRFNSGYGN